MRAIWRTFACMFVFDLARSASLELFNLTLLMPSGNRPEGKQSIHVATILPEDKELYIVKLYPVVDRQKIRSITTYLCSQPYVAKSEFWFDQQPCQSMDQSVMIYEWDFSVPPVQWPEDAGLQVGITTPYRYVVIKIEYSSSTPLGVYGEHITIARRTPKYKIGSYDIVADGFDLKDSRADFSCKLHSSKVQLFSALFFSNPQGQSISLYRVRKNQVQTVIKGNLSWPQTFYQVPNPMEMKMDDLLIGTCVYGRTSSIRTAARNAVCQLTLLFFAEQDDILPESECRGNDFPRAVERLLPSNLNDAPQTLFDINPAYPRLSPSEWAIMQMNRTPLPSALTDNNTHIFYLIYSNSDRHQELILLLRSHRLLILICIWLLLVLLGLVVLAIVIFRSRKIRKYPSTLKARSRAITVGGETSSLSGWLTKRRFQHYEDDDKTARAPLTSKHRWTSDTEGSELSEAEVFNATDFHNVVLRN